MTVDEIIRIDSFNLDLDEDLQEVLASMGFVQLDLSVAMVPKGWIANVVGTRADGSQQLWTSARPYSTPERAVTAVTATIAGWILNQPLGSVTP